jgi:hypothetical protein
MTTLLSYAIAEQFRSIVLIVGAIAVAALLVKWKPAFRKGFKYYAIALLVITFLDTPAIFSALTPVILAASIIPLAFFAGIFFVALFCIDAFFQWIDRIVEGRDAPN